jgi:hypothetical protein
VRENHPVISDAERDEVVRRTEAASKTHGRPDVVFHYSEDGSITRFAPHRAPSNPSHPPAVWAIDADHAPLYWFPRHCPRISVWANDDEQQRRLSEMFQTEASRICATETIWIDPMRSARLYEYRFDGSRFAPWTDADGQYIAGEVVYPDEVVLLDDLLSLHADAEVELRFTPKLGRLTDEVLASGLPFSFVRIRDARR